MALNFPSSPSNGQIYTDVSSGNKYTYYSNYSYWAYTPDSSGGGGATGGGTDEVFYENDQTVTTDYTITTDKNAMTAGPITVANGVVVTVPSGSTWTIV